MGIEAIDSKYGYGDTISSSNALQIYKDRECYNDLRPSQQKYVQKFLTQEQMDQVDYDMQTTDAKNNGKDKIEDAQKAESHDGQGGNAAATSVGGLAFAALAAAITKKANKWAHASGWKGLGWGIATLACSAASLVCAKLFDNAYKDRCATRDNADATNETIQSHSDALVESMDMMDESLETYQGQVEDFTDTTNLNNSRATELEIEIADAEAMGDMEKVRTLKEELANLSKFDYSGMEEDMDATREELDEYGMMAEESKGVAEGGTSVADFLKEGTPMGVIGMVNAAGLAVAAVYSSIAIASAMRGSGHSFSIFDFGGGAAGIAGSVLFAISAVLLGTGAYTMADKAKNEFECGSKGGEVQDYVNTLNTTIEDQIGYTESTTEDFDKTDEDSQESIAENKEKAGEAKEQADKTRKPVQKDKSGEGEEQTESIIS